MDISTVAYFMNECPAFVSFYIFGEIGRATQNRYGTNSIITFARASLRRHRISAEPQKIVPNWRFLYEENANSVKFSR